MRDLSNKSNLVLMGFMGTGKSSVGKRLAQVLDLGFVDTDLEIERLMNLSIPDIFAKYGEVRFRSEESIVIHKLAGWQGMVLSTGGGTVVDPGNLAALKENGILITLTADPQTIAIRTARKNARPRPLLKKDGSVAAIQKLLSERQFAYSQGDIILDTSLLTIDEVTNTLVSLLKERGYGKSKG